MFMKYPGSNNKLLSVIEINSSRKFRCLKIASVSFLCSPVKFNKVPSDSFLKKSKEYMLDYFLRKFVTKTFPK